MTLDLDLLTSDDLINDLGKQLISAGCSAFYALSNDTSFVPVAYSFPCEKVHNISPTPKFGVSKNVAPRWKKRLNDPYGPRFCMETIDILIQHILGVVNMQLEKMCYSGAWEPYLTTRLLIMCIVLPWL